MRPDASEQLDGAATVLEHSIAPLVDDAYALDVLNGTIANLRMLAGALDEVPGFLLWDIERTLKVLSLAGIEVPAVEVPAFDLRALRARHVEVRGLLESSIDAVRSDEAANTAAVAHFRERSARFPFVSTYRGGSLARRSR